jgi:RimJ/RimL family protein N-acetyltransferase
MSRSDASAQVAWDSATAESYARDVLVGDRTRLRGVAQADIEELVRWRQDATSEIFQTASLNPMAEADAREIFRSQSTPGNDRRGFVVETRPEGSDVARLLGFVSLSGISAQHRAATFAIALDPSAGGHGYGTDATRLMVRYGFRELGLHRIQLDVWAFNERAVRTYLKAGFVEEGRRRDAVFHDGRWHDEVLMSALATDPGWLD